MAGNVLVGLLFLRMLDRVWIYSNVGGGVNAQEMHIKYCPVCHKVIFWNKPEPILQPCCSNECLNDCHKEYK